MLRLTLRTPPMITGTLALPSCYTDAVRRFLCLLALIFSTIPALHAQTQADRRASSSPSGIFPLTLLLEAAEFADSPTEIWRPNWPAELPPDAFRLLSGESSRITLEGEGFFLHFSHDPEGRVEDFPFVLNGRMAQVSVVRQDGKIRTLLVSFPPNEDTWELEFLEYQDFSPPGNTPLGLSFPALVRASIGGVWYFITLSGWAREITETWFDAEGNVLGVYAFSLTEFGGNQRIRAVNNFFGGDNNFDLVYYYDSWGLLQKISGPGGVYTVLYYRDALPRYWERRPAGGDAGAFYFQWDANGFLVRMMPESAAEPESSAQPVEYRFEYTLDERGNWIERREIQMFRRADLLFPSPGATFRRTVAYR